MASGSSRPTAFVLPHTHWDREWYQTESESRQRLVEVVDDLILRLETDSRISTFLLDGQMAPVDDYLAVRAEMAKRLRKLARAGRLLLGPWYVLADELLVSDETLVRNLLVGRSAAEPLGAWMPLGYSPDAFGHPAALPSILAGFGIRHAILWRGYGDDPTGGRDLFRWFGPDGASVLVHHLPPAGYEIGAELPVEAEPLRKRWKFLRRALEPRSQSGHLLILNGADHHALQPDVADAVRALQGLEGRYEFRITSPADYFQAVDGVSVSRIEGELRFSYGYAWTLQGVHSTRSRLKRRIAEGERLLVEWAEPQVALAWCLGARDRRPLLSDAWRRHLRNCAHDSIGGCCADRVARDVRGRARGVVEAARTLFDRSLLDRVGLDRTVARRKGGGSRLLVVNPGPESRGGVVEATLTFFMADVPVGGPEVPSHRHAEPPPSPAVRTAAGDLLPVQVLDAAVAQERFDSPRDYPDQDLVHAVRVAVQVPPVAPLGVDVLTVETGRLTSPATQPVVASLDRLEAEWGSVGGTNDGFDWRVTGTRTLRGLPAIWSERDHGDTYTFQPVGHDRGLGVEWGEIAVGWSGPLIASLARPFAISGRVEGTVHVRLDADSDLVRLVVEGENYAGGHRLRVGVPVPSRGRTTADMHFGGVYRQRESYDRHDYRMEWPVLTAPMHRYVSVPGAGSDPGITVFARGIHEYELTEDDLLAVTVLRSVDELSRGDLRARPGHAGWPTPTPEARELGPFRIELGLARSSVGKDSSPGEWSALEGLASSFQAPLAGRMCRHYANGASSVAGPALEGDGLVFKALKPAQTGEGIVVRCANVSDQVVAGAWVWPGRLEGAALAHLDESPVRDLGHDGNPARVEFEAQPRAVVTLLLWPERR